MITIEYDDGSCGSGKTFRAIQEMCRNGGRHLLVVERVEAMRERKRMIYENMDEARRLRVELIHATRSSRAVQCGVRARIEDVPKDYAPEADLVIIISHEAMKLVDFSGFAGQGWSIWIDEVPSVLDHDKHEFCLSWEILDRLYRLEPDGKWSRVRIKDSSVGVSTLAHDEGLQVMRPFHRRVEDPRREVLVNLTTWDELAEEGRAVSWYSIWSPYELLPFDRVVMLGNALTQSISFRIWQEKFPDIEWRQIAAPQRDFLPRRVKIIYFAEAHRAMRSIFNSVEGRQSLGKVAVEVDRWTSEQPHIFTCNEADQESLSGISAERLSPRKAGSNDLDWATHVTAIYTAKPDPALIGVYERLGIDPEHHTVSAELETILQFVCRSAIRVADDPSDIYIRVYDRVQADYLREYFEGDTSRVIWVETELVNLGFANKVRDSRPGPKPTPLTPAEKAAKKERERLADRDRKRVARGSPLALPPLTAPPPPRSILPMINTSAVQPKRA